VARISINQSKFI